MRTLKAERTLDAPEEWLVATAETYEVHAGIASSPLAVPVFVIGWVCVGLLLTAAVPHPPTVRWILRGVGAGLGPLMAVVTAEASARRRAARPVVFARGVDHGGDLDVLVLIEERPGDVHCLATTLDAIAGDIGTLTLARALPHLSFEEDSNDALDEARSLLVTARDLVPIRGAALVAFPDAAPEAAVEWFATTGSRRLVLHAVGDRTPTSERW